MFETTSDGLSIKDIKSEANVHSDTFILPLINKKPLSRGSLTQNKSFIKKQNVGLPTLKGDSHSFVPEIQSLQNARNNENKSEFALQVEEKLKFVLGEMKEEYPNEGAESFDEDELDFQQKINRNRKLIKEHKKKQENDEGKTIQKKEKKRPPRSKPPKHRNESLYEKRGKQYRDESNENGMIQKKKMAFIKEKEKNERKEEALKEIKQKDSLTNKQSQKKSASKKNQRSLSQKSSHKEIRNSKDQNLFDHIQDYLENPREKAASKEKEKKKSQLVGLSLMYAKRDLEQKVKILEQKLGVEKESHEQQKIREMEPNEWCKVEIENNKVKVEGSTFEKEVDRLNDLQDRNSRSLEKYVDHRRMLVQLYYQKKQSETKIETN